jgi:Flp pilus assembly protein TadB
MWIGFAIGLAIGTPQLLKRFARRHEPEPRHGRLKLPVTLLLLAACVALAALGVEPLLLAILASLFAIQVGFILAGRNPWWMQDSLDQRERPRYTTDPPRDLDPSP